MQNALNLNTVSETTYGIQHVPSGSMLVVSEFGCTKNGSGFIQTARFTTKHLKTQSIAKVVEFANKDQAVNLIERILKNIASTTENNYSDNTYFSVTVNRKAVKSVGVRPVGDFRVVEIVKTASVTLS